MASREKFLNDYPGYYQSRGGGICSNCLSKGCGCIVNLLCCCLMVASVATLWNYIGRPTSMQDLMDGLGNYDLGDFDHVLPNISDTDWSEGFNEDPYVSDDTFQVWKGTDGYSGLKLTLLNALDDSWQTEFADAYADWSESEALTLTTQRVDVDHTCASKEGYMVVCNGNFGNTGWLGINEVVLVYGGKSDTGVIISSVAKMNEYYLNKASYAQRRYTMCHELGHGFGLPHTDENPYNKNIYNCLDYSLKPESNMYPGEINFNRLATLYLGYTFDDDDGKQDGEYDRGDGDEDGDGDDRYLRRVTFTHYDWV